MSPNQNRKMSSKGKLFLRKCEGLRLVIYQDGGALGTIGIGHRTNTITKCTAEQAEAWFEADIKIAEDYVKKAIRLSLTDYQFDALVSFSFNTGNGLDEKVGQYINARNFTEAMSWLTRWVHDSKERAEEGLFLRRAREAMIFLGKAPGYFLTAKDGGF